MPKATKQEPEINQGKTVFHQNENCIAVPKDSPIAIYELDLLTLKFKWANQFVSRLLGYSEEELLALSVTELLCDSSKKVFQQNIDQAIEGKHSFFRSEVQVKTKNGSSLWGSFNSKVIFNDGKPTSVLVFAQDITERKKAEVALENLLHDYDGRVKDLNCLLEISKLVETKNISLYKILQGVTDSLPSAWQFPELTCSRIILREREFRTTNFKQTKWKLQSIIRVNGKKTGLIEVYYTGEKPEIIEDPFLKEERMRLASIAERIERIIERKKQENMQNKSDKKIRSMIEELRQRECEVSALFKASEIVLLNRDFNVSARGIFDACKELVGATAGYVALLNQNEDDNIVLFLDSGGIPCFVDATTPMPIRGLRAVAYLKSEVAFDNAFAKSEYKKYLPQGHVHLKNVLFAPLIIDSKTLGLIGLANKPGGFSERDVNIVKAFGKIAAIALINSNMLDMLEENKKRLAAQNENLEKLVEERTNQLRDSERLAAIGSTAGMVGHDIRNPLQAIAGDLYLIDKDVASLNKSETQESLWESLRSIQSNLMYIAKIVDDLQDYAKPLKPNFEKVRIETIIEEVMPLMPVNYNHQVVINIEKDFPEFTTDIAMLKRIVVNLIHNALQAMHDDGRLTIQVYQKDRLAFIKVEDTGVGIPDEIKPKLFTPLVTTKSKGQGFGLAVVKRLVEALDGSITFESKVDKGTIFTVELPLNRA